MFMHLAMSSLWPYSLNLVTFKTVSQRVTILRSDKNFKALASRLQLIQTANSLVMLSTQSNGIVLTSASSIANTRDKTPPMSAAMCCLSFISTQRLPTKLMIDDLTSTLLPSPSQSGLLSAPISGCSITYRIDSTVDKNSAGGSCESILLNLPVP